MNPFLQELAAQQLERIVTPETLDQEYILESLQQAVPMLRNLARAYDMEFDDLHQETYLLLHTIMADPTKPHHRAYLQGAIRYRVYDLLRHRRTAISLDEPQGDGDTTLIDMLVEPTKPQQTRRDYYRKRALLKALRRLPEGQQRAINLFYRIERLKVASHRSIAPHTASTYRSKSVGQLRQDKYLNKAIMGTWR